MPKLIYENYLEPYARKLRSNLTDAETLLWRHIRRKQILDTQFFRQRPIGNFIVDFYAPKARLVIEIDGGQHFEKENQERDRIRDVYLSKKGLMILRFNNRQVMAELHSVLEEIYRIIQARKNISAKSPFQIPLTNSHIKSFLKSPHKSPLTPLLQRGEQAIAKNKATEKS